MQGNVEYDWLINFRLSKSHFDRLAYIIAYPPMNLCIILYYDLIELTSPRLI